MVGNPESRKRNQPDRGSSGNSEGREAGETSTETSIASFYDLISYVAQNLHCAEAAPARPRNQLFDGHPICLEDVIHIDPLQRPFKVLQGHFGDRSFTCSNQQ